MKFCDLQQRLLEYLGAQIRNRETSGRKLAAMTGMSQGHVTNVLRRRRPLSLDRADDILSHLNADVRDFIKTEELLESLQARRLGASPPKVSDESFEPPDQPDAPVVRTRRGIRRLPD